MFATTPSNSWTALSKSSKDLNTSNTDNVNSDNSNSNNNNNDNRPIEVESMVELSGSSNQSMPNKAPEDVNRLVHQTLQKVQSICQSQSTEALMELVVPKVLYDLNAYEQLNEEMRSMKQSLDAYIQHSRVLGEDIAEIFLDLHNIYTRLDKLDKCAAKTPRDQKFNKRLCEAEALIQSNKHYIVNDAPAGQISSIPLLDSSSQAVSDGDAASMTCSETRYAARQAFLSNMLLVKKSDFSLELNRSKNYYADAERVLNQNKDTQSDSENRNVVE